MTTNSAAARIRQAMGPDPTAWYFTGQVIDHKEYGNAACACGHPVRYRFLIVRPGDPQPLGIGSKCIQRLLPELEAAGAKTLARDLRQEIRRVEDERELPQLTSDLRMLREWCWGRRREWQDRHRAVDDMPNVLYVPPKLPEEEVAHEAAQAIRRRYTPRWFQAATAAVAEGMTLPPLPQRGSRLWRQVGTYVKKRAANEDHRDHQSGQAVRDAYYEPLRRAERSA